MRSIILLVVSMGLAGLAGCGGSSTPIDPTSFIVTIAEVRVTPKFDTINQNDEVTFLNSSAPIRQVISGSLTPSGNPLTIHLITIGNTGFNPPDTQANLGDTIRFSNATLNTFFLDIVDDNGRVVSSLTLAPGNMQNFTFPGAGVFIVRNRQNILFRGTVTLFGTPNPDNRFQSPALGNGDTFTIQFTQKGSFPYFVIDTNSPGRAYITGSISVQ